MRDIAEDVGFVDTTARADVLLFPTKHLAHWVIRCLLSMGKGVTAAGYVVGCVPTLPLRFTDYKKKGLRFEAEDSGSG